MRNEKVIKIHFLIPHFLFFISLLLHHIHSTALVSFRIFTLK